MREQVKPYMVINTFLFISFLVFGGLLFFILPKQLISENEKRMLTPFPKFNTKAIFTGHFTDSVDLYFSDNFCFRNELIQFANILKQNKGWIDDELIVYNIDKHPAFHTDINDTLFMDHNITNDSISDSIVSPIKLENFNTGDPVMVNSVFIYNKRAIQIFGGTAGAAKNFAQLVNSYQSKLDGRVNVYCMAIPIGVDFYLPEKYKKKSVNEKSNIEILYNSVNANVKTVDAYKELEQHKDEYLYFNTDHHWTGRGAYYAYRAFCEAAGFTPYELSQMKRGVIKNFLGTLYYLTLNASLRENKDSVEYFKIPIETKVSYYQADDYKKSYASRLYAEYARGGNAYGVFLGGDYPLIKVISEVKNGKKIVILKDSYGNAFAPFLPLHYEEVYIIDYRYYNDNLVKLIENNQITDLIFAHSTYVINTAYTTQRERRMLTGNFSDTIKKTNITQLDSISNTIKIDTIKK